jgi:hypothetical protein
MERVDILGYVMIFVVIVLICHIYFNSDNFHLKCIVSTVDGEKYCVRERKNIQKVADLLAKVTQKMKRLVSYVGEKYPERENVVRLVKGFSETKIQETLPTSEFTAYSENKGEKLAFCVTDKKNGSNLIDEDTLTFVAIHEVSHIMSEQYQHKDEFWSNFKFMLENAKEAGIYDPVDYKKKPREYCGMKITDNPYYDY